jgi:hypothetical protein
VPDGTAGPLDGEGECGKGVEAPVVDGGAGEAWPGGGDLAADLRRADAAVAPADDDQDLGELGAEPAEVGEHQELRVLAEGIGAVEPLEPDLEVHERSLVTTGCTREARP